LWYSSALDHQSNRLDAHEVLPGGAASRPAQQTQIYVSGDYVLPADGISAAN